jgi:Domain of unknown function (DUF4335)
MTIRRQYSLPNCTLVLDGLSDSSFAGTGDSSRPLMFSLFNAECHFVGHEQHLFGGKDFLTSLVASVSNYAQEFLSGVHHPIQSQPSNSLVSIVKGDREDIHHLQAQLESTTDPAATAQPTQIDLSTVQLFDLLEAIDQFLADRRTLPDIMVPLQPIRKAIAQPISTQAVPMGLGLAGLVAASLIGYALPNPEVVAPKPIDAPKVDITTPKQPVTAPTPASSKQNKTDTTSTSTKTGVITEATQIGFLERKLQRDLNQNWQERGQIKQTANFLVNVNQDGKIVSYKPADKTNTAQSDLTPLPKLSTKNADPNQAIGNFNVVFNPTGSIEISPVEKLQGSMNLGKEITEPKLQSTLAEQLKTKLKESVTSKKPINNQDLTYRVGVTKTGEIADYEATDRVAAASETKTPLPKLAKFNPQAAISQEPLAQYKVVFGANGEILVTPR